MRAGLYLNFFLGSKLVVERPIAPNQADIVEITLQVITFLNRYGLPLLWQCLFRDRRAQQRRGPDASLKRLRVELIGKRDCEIRRSP